MTRDDARALGRKKFFPEFRARTAILPSDTSEMGSASNAGNSVTTRKWRAITTWPIALKTRPPFRIMIRLNTRKSRQDIAKKKGFCLRSSRTSWMRSVSKNSFFCGKWRSKGFGHGGSKTRERSSRFTPSADHQKSAQSLCGLVNSMLLCGTKLLNLQFDERRPPASTGTSTT